MGVLDSLDGDGWVVMTNGKLWRLYSARAHSRATNYYEIDLEETLASPDPGQAFRYFWLFFRSISFSLLPPAGERERAELAEGVRACFLDRLLDESASYAKALGERLKNRVFEQVFPHFAAGFIQHWRKSTGKTAFNDDELAQVFQGTLTFLYRLLFLLYAEARDLLPAREVRDYYDASLQRIKEEIARKAGAVLEEAEAKLEKSYSADSTDLYDALTHLFRSLDRGDPTLNVPVYNGGLFITFDGEPPLLTKDDSPELHNAVFLARHKIPDRFLALGLDRLARDVDEKTFALAMIDYKSLGVRQLGSIYEGLLEFKLRIAAEKMAVVRGKKGEEIVPYAQAVKQGLKIKASGRGSGRKEQIIPKGTVYLTNDRRERKATGSYYTPDYIVKYIVQHTVGPALEAKCEATRPLIREAQQAYRRAVERQRAFQKQGMAGDDPEKVAHSYRHVVDALFDLRVLDPAMGSGHFLVEAVDFITDRLLTFLSAFPWNPVTAALRQTRQTILEEMQRQGVNVDPARLTDVHLLKRHVLKRCIYGVDLNPMAVELAKVSLWLDCFTLGAPLSFLDHHLKCGNSLIGARTEEVRAALDMAAEKDRLEIPLLAGMMGSQFAGVMLATDLMRRVGELSDVTAAQVRESREEYRRASDALAPYRRILDVYTSRWFGNPDTRLSSPVLDFLRNPKTEAWLQNPADRNVRLKPDEQKLGEIALRAAREKRFFHWELEFPEVFFGPGEASAQQIEMKKNPGFNAVIGNPPYIRVELLSEEIKNYISSVYSEIAKGRPDLYLFFAYHGTKILQKGGFISLITPGKFTAREHGLELRKYWITENRIRYLLDLSKCASMFPDAIVYPCIFVVERQVPSEEDQTVVAVAISDCPEQVIKQHTSKATFSSNDGFGYSIYQKDLALSPDYAFNLQAEPSHRLLLSKLQSVSEELETLCDTRQGIIAGDVSKYVISRDQITKLPPRMQRLIKPVISGRHIERYGALESNQFIIYDVENLVAPREKGIFERPKFVMQDMSDLMEASLDLNNYYCMDTTTLGFVRNGFAYKLGYILSVLNSKIIHFFMNESFSGAQIRGGYLRFRPQFVERIPVRKINFTTPEPRHTSLTQEAKELVSSEDTYGLLTFTAQRLSAQPEESDVVHDLLAFLAQKMIEMNKQKQSEMKRYLGWLEGNLKIQPDKKGNTGLEALTGKSQLRNYLGDYQKGEAELSFDELQDILFKNRNRLGVSLNDPRFTARLQEEYEKSLAVLLPIKEKLRWTDNLIDQIVYRLYGLTEEEIAVVEGRG